MKKLIILLLPVILLAGCYKKPATPLPVPVTKDDRISYDNSEYGFSFKFPRDLQFIESQKNKEAITSSSYIPACDPETSIACLLYSKETHFANTNFDSAGFSVNIISAANGQATCVSLADRGYQNQEMTKQVINGVEYDTATVGDAALGHFLNEKVYRTFRDGTCFEIALRVAQSNFQNYDPSLGVKEFAKTDEAAVWQKLEAVLATFQLN